MNTKENSVLGSRLSRDREEGLTDAVDLQEILPGLEIDFVGLGKQTLSFLLRLRADLTPEARELRLESELSSGPVEESSTGLSA